MKSKKTKVTNIKQTYTVNVEPDDTFKGKWNVVMQKGEKWWAVYMGTKKKCLEIAKAMEEGFEFIERNEE